LILTNILSNKINRIMEIFEKEGFKIVLSKELERRIG
jgi:nucleoside diphosphate kinase